MFREIAENRYIIRKYLRALSVSKNVNGYMRTDTAVAIKFFIILHNSLIIEDTYYDQFAIANQQINKYLNLQKSWRVDDVLSEFYKVYNKGSKVRNSLDRIKYVEEAKLLLEKEPMLLRKLKL